MESSASPQDLLNHIADAASAKSTSSLPGQGPTSPFAPASFSLFNQDSNFTGPPPGVLQSFDARPDTAVFDRDRAAQTYKQVSPLGFSAFEMSSFTAPASAQTEGDDDWGASSQPKRKRDTELLKLKHSSREKRRRSELNESIDKLKEVLPKVEKSRYRSTKVSTLNEAIDYIVRLKEQLTMTIREKNLLLEENAMLSQQLGIRANPQRDHSSQLLSQLASAQPLTDSGIIAPSMPLGALPGQNIHLGQSQLPHNLPPQLPYTQHLQIFQQHRHQQQQRPQQPQESKPTLDEIQHDQSSKQPAVYQPPAAAVLNVVPQQQPQPKSDAGAPTTSVSGSE